MKNFNTQYDDVQNENHSNNIAISSTQKAITEPEQQELFVCDITHWPIKDDMASMEIPLFNLSKNKSLETREYHRGNKSVRIIPSSVGAATVFDKDLLLYISSQITEARNLGKTVSRTVQIETIDFLVGTDRGDGRGSFEAIIDMLRRLRGTTIETNIETGGQRQTKGFSMIDDYEVLSEKKRSIIVKDSENDTQKKVDIVRVLRFKVTISEWLYNGLMKFEVLALNRGYFKIGKPTDRRLYEIARKHCGEQPMWKINIDALAEKAGMKGARFKIREEIREAIKRDALLDYQIALDTQSKPDNVVFYTRNPAKLAKELIRMNNSEWFLSLERSNDSKNSELSQISEDKS